MAYYPFKETISMVREELRSPLRWAPSITVTSHRKFRPSGPDLMDLLIHGNDFNANMLKHTAALGGAVLTGVFGVHSLATGTELYGAGELAASYGCLELASYYGRLGTQAVVAQFQHFNDNLN